MITIDIVVTIPKRSIGEFHREWIDLKNSSLLCKYFKLHQKPRDLKVGDHVYFVIDGKVRFKSKFIGYSSGEFNCMTTGNNWDGFFIKCNDFEEYNGPNANGFRGFRYVWW